MERGHCPRSSGRGHVGHRPGPSERATAAALGPGWGLTGDGFAAQAKEAAPLSYNSSWVFKVGNLKNL